jgi:hypothetical protein
MHEVFDPAWLQPLPPKAILKAAAALFAAGGRLRGVNAANGIGTDAGGALGPAALGLQSYYAPWILADLAHWSHSGISQVLCKYVGESKTCVLTDGWHRARLRGACAAGS